MDASFSGRRHRRIFGVDEEDIVRVTRRTISEEDSYHLVLDYVRELEKSAQNARRKESYEKKLFDELRRFNKRDDNEKNMLEDLETLISQRAYEERISFIEVLNELKEKKSLHGYFDYLTAGGRWGNYGGRLEKLKSVEEGMKRYGGRNGGRRGKSGKR